MLSLKNIVLFLVFINNAKSQVHIVSGVYWSKLSEVMVYESSVPIIYKSALPTNSGTWTLRLFPDKSYCNNQSTPLCKTATFLHHLEMEFSNLIQLLEDSIGQEGTTDALNWRQTLRKSRGIQFLGEALNWCCNTVTKQSLEPLFVNEERLTQAINKLNLAVNHDQVELNNVINSISNFSSRASRVFEQSQKQSFELYKIIEQLKTSAQLQTTEVDQNIHFIWHYLINLALQNLENLHVFSRHQIINKCHSHRIPSELISANTIIKDLNKLEHTLIKNNYELVIKTNEISHYYKLKLASCHISSSKITVIIKVPLRKVNNNWVLFRALTIPFAWERKTCVFHNKMLLVAKSNTDSYLITDFTHCNVDDKLCLLPRTLSSGDSELSCITHLVNGAQISEVIEFCKPTCKNVNAMQIKQLEPEKFIVVHPAEFLKLNCGNESKTMIIKNYQTPGAFEIDVPCTCSLLSLNRTLVSKKFPCDLNTIDNFSIKHILPAMWSNFNSFKLQPLSSKTYLTFSNITEGLNNSYFNNNLEEKLQLDLATNKYYPTLSEVRLKSLDTNTHSSWHILRIINVISIILLIIIILRNPYLIGFGYFPQANAWDGSSLIADLTGGAIIVLIVCFLGWMLYTVIKQNRKKRERVQEMLKSSLEELETLRVERNNKAGKSTVHK